LTRKLPDNALDVVDIIDMLLSRLSATTTTRVPTQLISPKKVRRRRAVQVGGDEAGFFSNGVHIQSVFRLPGFDTLGIAQSAVQNDNQRACSFRG
jgi:hypothetical protein